MEGKPIQQVQDKSERALKEEKILRFWQDNQIFEKTLEKDAPKGEFVFYDGPPFATGLPHAGSLLSSVIKDVIPRYKTMRGYHVRRRWGWDCHGLPIENMIEKELGIKDKTEIESKLGIKTFNEACRSSVLRYAHDWKKYVDRVGRWVDYDNSYKTMDNTFIESVWYALKEINNKGLLYEGRKVLLYCPRCETPIAKAEIAMDNSYKDVTEESVTVEFRIRGSKDTSLLAWTTTPWTLPGNVALAVHPDVDYVEIEKKDLGVGELVRFILAKNRLQAVFGNDEYTIVREMKGRDLVGIEYEPLFEIQAVKDTGKKAFYVAEADFVTTEDGTGIVHTAVIYGEDDYNLGLKLDLPMVPLLDNKGHFNNNAPDLISGQYFKKAEKAIKEDLEKRGLMFKREMNTHSYPHCHRCGTALIYNALTSWFINIQKVKDKMLSLNEKINWVPEHLKHGRFLNIVENAPDWTISRNRYWASPLPIWKDESGKVYVIGSLEELKRYTKKSGNKFIFVRHGEAENNVRKVINCDPQKVFNLTEKGREQAEKLAKEIGKVDAVYVSPYTRTKETAEIIAKEIGFEGETKEDSRIRELDFGDLNGRPFAEYIEYEKKNIHTYDTKLPNGESYNDAKKRIAEFIYEIDKNHSNEKILVVTHGMGLEAAAAIIEGADLKKSKEIIDSFAPEPAETLEFEFVPLPHNDNFELDLHRPYIDEIELVTEDGKELKRIPEVIDGWVESASMPFAEYHYPFENKQEFEKRFPGDFVAEYIAQTRTWFYYMHALATILFDNIAFKNVVTTGNILAADGSKMSKSKGNYTDPLVLLDRFGADAFRFYLMSSVVMQAEDASFKDEEVKEVQNRLINILSNSFTFYDMFSEKGQTLSIDPQGLTLRSEHILDKWILARLDQLVEEVTQALESYDTVRATRPIREFVTDLSTWYIRRSRDRFKGENVDDKKAALATSRHLFKELSKLIAPLMPFIAEEIYEKVRGDDDPSSVHLANWPTLRQGSAWQVTTKLFGGGKDEDILAKMSETRRLVSLALEARQKANVKVRQPLAKLEVKTDALDQEYLEIIKDELNVKEVQINNKLEGDVALDTNLTSELIEEGRVRDAIRAVQEWRKEKGLKPGEIAQYTIDNEQRDFFMKHAEEIKRVTHVEF